jgi:hypothetical protein
MMNDSNADRQAWTRFIGLCAACAHHRTVVSQRGSRFLFCQRSVSDPAFPRYPELPVLRCAGYEPDWSGQEGV